MPQTQTTQMELQYLRHLVGEAQLASTKFGTYSEQCQDPQLKQMLQTESAKCQKKADQLMSFLQ